MATLQWFIFLTFIPAIFGSYKSQPSLLGQWNIPCNETKQCDDINSVCNNNGTCQCRPGYIISNYKPKCLKVAVAIEDSCEESKQCQESLSEGSICKDNKCVCSDYEKYFRGQCWWADVSLNEACIPELGNLCFAGSEYQASTCKTGRCKCSEGFYQRDKATCRRKTKNIGDECLLDQDCDFIHGTCVKEKCVRNGQSIFNAQPIEIVKPTSKKEGGIKIGEKCETITDCKSIGNSICDVDGICICERAYFASKDKTICIPEIGVECNPATKDSLHVEYAVCRENIWTCPIDRFPTNYNRECQRLTASLSGNCNADDQCQLFGPVAECNPDKCLCPKRSRLDFKKQYCRLDLGGECKEDRECDASNSLCVNSKCLCKNYHNELNGQCYLVSGAECDELGDCKCSDGYVNVVGHWCQPKQKLNEKCMYNEQCAASVDHSTCNKDKGRCECLNGYFTKEGKCYKKKDLDDTCADTNECNTENSECDNGKCQCKPKFTNVDRKCNSSTIIGPLFSLVVLILLGLKTLS